MMRRCTLFMLTGTRLRDRLDAAKRMVVLHGGLDRRLVLKLFEWRLLLLTRRVEVVSILLRGQSGGRL